jgi:LuxR family maltose regulon positive regulatory protein
MDRQAERSGNVVMPLTELSGTPGDPAVAPLTDRVVVRWALVRRLDEAKRVVQVSAPAGTGKTVLLRSWIAESGLAQRAAWVKADCRERDSRAFWIAVAGALRATTAGSALVRPLTAAPDQGGWAIVERLLTDLAPLGDRLWLVIDDAQELGPEALRQLGFLIMRAPRELRLVMASRHDLRMGLHRLRLEGDLTEIRQRDLRFTVAETVELFAAAGVELSDAAVALLHERTEGWAAGLRLAALSLARHPTPERFAAEFSGSERTAAEYLLAEVLDRQDHEVRRLLLRTSIVEEVNGELADLLTGASGGERVLLDLEQANAFVVSLDPARTRFRYHQMFAALLQLELRRAAPLEITGLHEAASGWFAKHGHPVEAIRHAQAAGNWELAARLLADNWPGLYLAGQDARVRRLLAEFPPAVRAADAHLAAVSAADELAHGSMAAAEQYQELAELAAASLPEARRDQAQLLLGIVRLLLARQRRDLPTVVEEARRLRVIAEALVATQPDLENELDALALISFGITEHWAATFEDTNRHLTHGVALARQVDRPFLEFTGLAYQAATEFFQNFALAAEHARQAAELARRNGWTDTPAAGIATMVLGSVLVLRGRLEEAEPLVHRAERTLEADADPGAGVFLRYIRGLLELGRGRYGNALDAFQAAERLAGLAAAPDLFVSPMRALVLQALVRLGERERAERSLAEFSEHDRERGDIRIATATLRLAQGDLEAVITALAPILDGSAPVFHQSWLAQAFLLEAIARDALGDPGAAEEALERALDLAEPDGWLFVFLQDPASGLLERHRGHRTTHAAMIAESLSLLAGRGRTSLPAEPRPLDEPLTDSELRVLRYLPTNLTGPEIAAELYVSPHTVKTHMRHLYAKLGAHHRTEAVTRARGLGLLAPGTRRVKAGPGNSPAALRAVSARQ